MNCIDKAFAAVFKKTSNGNGISPKILDKIFQPFFTTIPIAIGKNGQGTGLGLSLSYDIVKAHGGELSVRTPLEKVETKGVNLLYSYPLSESRSKVSFWMTETKR